MGKTSSPVDMKFYGLEWIGIWANQKMSIYRLYNKFIYCLHTKFGLFVMENQ